MVWAKAHGIGLPSIMESASLNNYSHYFAIKLEGVIQDLAVMCYQSPADVSLHDAVFPLYSAGSYTTVFAFEDAVFQSCSHNGAFGA